MTAIVDGNLQSEECSSHDCHLVSFDLCTRVFMHYRLVLVAHCDDFQVDVGDCEQSYWHILITE